MMKGKLSIGFQKDGYDLITEIAHFEIDNNSIAFKMTDLLREFATELETGESGIPILRFDIYDEKGDSHEKVDYAACDGTVCG